MAYNNFYPQYYPQYQQQSQPQQIQNGGFVSVRCEEEARCYPVALGNSITFKDESNPYIYTKTMGFSQLDTPKFEKYRLVKEEPSQPRREPEESQAIKLSSDEIKSEIEALWGEIKAIKNDLKEGV